MAAPWAQDRCGNELGVDPVFVPHLCHQYLSTEKEREREREREREKFIDNQIDD